MIKVNAADVLTAAAYLHSTSIDALDMPALTGNALVIAGIRTLADLARADLARVPGIGHGGMMALRSVMATRGFTLNEQPADPFFVGLPNVICDQREVA